MPQFFMSSAVSGAAIHYDYSLGYVLVSIAVAMLSGIIALKIADVARLSDKPQLRHIAIISGTLALGGGIWSMHFIGMLAINIGLHIHYDPLITAASILPSVFASWVALQMLASDRIDNWQLLSGGALVAAGIGAMHYSGMMAMHTDAVILYDPWIFALSLLSAVVLTTFALWVKFKLAETMALGETQSTVLAGSLLGLATTATHYIGMEAARIIATHDTTPSQFNNHEHIHLVMQIGLTTLALSLLVFVGNLLLRYRELNHQLIRSEARSRAIVEGAVDGIISVDDDGRIVAMNEAAEHLFGWAFQDVAFQSVQMLFATPIRFDDQSEAVQELQGGKSRELLAKCRDGQLRPIRLAVGKIAVAEQTLYVGFATDMTERVRMEQEILARESHYRSLIKTFPGVIFRCEARSPWRPLFISEAMTQISGWAPEQFIQRKQRFSTLIVPEDVEPFRDCLARAVKSKKDQFIEFRLIDRFGQERAMLQCVRYVRDPISRHTWIDGTMMDITPLKSGVANPKGAY